MTQERHQLAVIITKHVFLLAELTIVGVDQRGAIIESAKATRRFALHKRRVARAPAFACADIAQKVEQQRTEWVVARFGPRAYAVNFNAHLMIFGAMLFELVPVAGGERKAIAVVDRALRDHAHDFLEARVVLESAHAVGLFHQGAATHEGGTVDDLHDCGGGDYNRPKRCEEDSGCQHGTRERSLHGWKFARTFRSRSC